MNGLLEEIISLLQTAEGSASLALLGKGQFYTCADVLVVLGHYKGALRSHRVNVLGEGQFDF